uniref:Uncharacterized protein n=1 Tax=Nelumbo nucifera TaxID=4432 RepID=A0A822ZDK7_NELNU|nr:TPA_asm: hypothetical protein HUJ06_000893 [Nelumbo nucifera]
MESQSTNLVYFFVLQAKSNKKINYKEGISAFTQGCLNPSLSPSQDTQMSLASAEWYRVTINSEMFYQR